MSSAVEVVHWMYEVAALAALPLIVLAAVITLAARFDPPKR